MKERRMNLGLALLVSAILVILLIPTIAMAGSWEQFQRDEVNSGNTTDAAPLAVNFGWRTQITPGAYHGINVVPIVAGDKIFGISAGAKIWAFNTTTGERMWSGTLNDAGGGFQLATPAYGDGKVFFATNGGRVEAVYPENGTEIWSKKIADTNDQLNTPVTYANGKVFVGSWKSQNGNSNTGIYYCLNASNGDLLWSRSSIEHVYDFKTSTGTDKWAYTKQITPTGADEPHEVFSSADYEKIKTDDQDRKESVTDTDGKYAAHRFNFSISESASEISKINITWNGIGDHDYNAYADGAKLYIWNFTDGNYIELANNTVDTDATLTGEVTSSISNYISPTGNVTILVNQTSAQTTIQTGPPSARTKYSRIKTDYIKLAVQLPGGKGYYWAGCAVIGDYIVFGDDSNNLTSLYKNNGNYVDSVNLDNYGPQEQLSIRSSIVWNATNNTYGYLFFTAKNRVGACKGYVWKVGFNKSTGDIVQSDYQNSSNIYYSTSTPAIYKGRVYVGGGNFSVGSARCLLCLNESDLTDKKWEYTANGAVQSSPALSIQNGDPYIYFTTNCKNGKVYCINKTGSEVWNFSTFEAGQTSGSTWLGAILQGVSISDNKIFFGNDGGYLYGMSNTTPDAYGNQSASPTASDPSIEFTATQYAKIRVDDGDLQSDVTTGTGSNYSVHRFNFSIATPVSNVSKINVTWNGKGWHDTAGNNGTDLYIYNFTSGSYGSAIASNDNDAEVTLTGERTSGISNYINSGNVTVLVKQKSAQAEEMGDYYRSHIATDYVRVIITTT